MTKRLKSSSKRKRPTDFNAHGYAKDLLTLSYLRDKRSRTKGEWLGWLRAEVSAERRGGLTGAVVSQVDRLWEAAELAAIEERLAVAREGTAEPELSLDHANVLRAWSKHGALAGLIGQLIAKGAIQPAADSQEIQPAAASQEILPRCDAACRRSTDLWQGTGGPTAPAAAQGARPRDPVPGPPARRGPCSRAGLVADCGGNQGLRAHRAGDGGASGRHVLGLCDAGVRGGGLLHRSA